MVQVVSSIQALKFKVFIRKSWPLGHLLKTQWRLHVLTCVNHSVLITPFHVSILQTMVEGKQGRPLLARPQSLRSFPLYSRTEPHPTDGTVALCEYNCYTLWCMQWDILFMFNNEWFLKQFLILGCNKSRYNIELY